MTLRFIRRGLFFFVIILLPFLPACGQQGGLESSPVSLPVPFSGALRATNFVEIGCPRRLTTLNGHPAADQWNLVESSENIGWMTIDYSSLTDRQTTANWSSFRANVRLSFNDGATFVSASGAQLYEYEIGEEANCPLSECTVDGLEESTSPPCTAVGGMALATISETDEANKSLIGSQLVYYFRHLNANFSDGTKNPIISDSCSWSLHPIEGEFALTSENTSALQTASFPQQALECGSFSPVPGEENAATISLCQGGSVKYSKINFQIDPTKGRIQLFADVEITKKDATTPALIIHKAHFVGQSLEGGPDPVCSGGTPVSFTMNEYESLEVSDPELANLKSVVYRGANDLNLSNNTLLCGRNSAYIFK